MGRRDGVTIKTNNRRQWERTLNDLPAKEREVFDYVTDPDEPRFVKVRGEWVDTHEFTAFTRDLSVDEETDFPGWQGWQTWSYFDAALLRYTDDGEVVTGYAHW